MDRIDSECFEPWPEFKIDIYRLKCCNVVPFILQAVLLLLHYYYYHVLRNSSAASAAYLKERKQHAVILHCTGLQCNQSLTELTLICLLCALILPSQSENSAALYFCFSKYVQWSHPGRSLVTVWGMDREKEQWNHPFTCLHNGFVNLSSFHVQCLCDSCRWWKKGS